MKELQLTDVKQAAIALEGQRLETLHRKARFSLKVQTNGFVFIPEGSGKELLQGWKNAQQFLERFNKTNSFSPADYKDMSGVASYVLNVIRSITR
ncbi:MAG TPA: hypothetical protein VMS31_17510 [Pyrinomonadaceae bacterium]|nr:hypothetical protein [Pyrinomonadaceae bacterium]